MDQSETYMNVKLGKTVSRSPSRAEPDVPYAELHFKTLSAPRVRIDQDRLNSTYSELNVRKGKPCIGKDEDPPISSGPGGLSTTAQTGAQKEEPIQNIGKRPDCKICLLCLVVLALIAIVVGFSIYVLQTRQSLITSERNYRRLWEQYQEMNRTQRQYQQQVHELNSTLESRDRTHSDHLYQYNQLEMKYRNINGTKSQICQYLTRRRELTCPFNWIKNEGRCFFISMFAKSYDGARERCSELDSRLLEINSYAEQNFVSKEVSRYVTYWIGKCVNGIVASDLLYKVYYESSTCRKCNSSIYNDGCKKDHRYICEKSAHLYPDIPEEIRGLCQQPVG